MKEVNIKVNIPLRLKRVGFGIVGSDLPEPMPAAQSWRLYSAVEDGEEDECQLRADMAKLEDKRDLKAAVQAVTKLVRVASLGDPLQVHYDEKQCHPLHRFHYRGKECVIWRIRKNSIRLPFYYGNGRLIFLTGALVKRKDKLTGAEQSTLEDQVKRYIDAEQADNLRMID